MWIRRALLVATFACSAFGCIDDVPPRPPGDGGTVGDGGPASDVGDGGAGDCRAPGGGRSDGGPGDCGVPDGGAAADSGALIDAGPAEATGNALRLGDTFVINASSSAPAVPITGARWTDVAFDSTNGVFLAAWSSLGSVYGRFISQDGAPLGEPFLIPDPTSPYAYPDHPRLAFSPHKGAFLVVYREERGAAPDPPPAHTLPMVGRFVAFAAGGAASFGGPSFQISTGDVNGTGTGPALAYSPASQEFLVAYMAAGLYAQRVSNMGTLLGAALTLAPAGEWDTEPTLAHNPASDEFYVGWHREVTSPHQYFVLGRRVKAGTGALIDSPQVIAGPAGGAQHTPEVQFDPVRGRYLIIWSSSAAPPQVWGRFVKADNTPDGAAFTVSNGAAFYDGLGLAYNPFTRTFASTFTHAPTGDDDRVWVVHLSSAGGVGTETRLTSPEATTDYSRIAAHPGRAEWMSISIIRYTTTLGQRVGLP